MCPYIRTKWLELLLDETAKEMERDGLINERTDLVDPIKINNEL